jgi:hypothetical protein
MSRLAAARTMPVTNAAKQENSRKSLTTLAMMPPCCATCQWLAPIPSACPYRGQNVAAPARIDDYCGHSGDGTTLMPIEMSCQCPNKNPARGEWVAGFRDGRLCGLGSSEPSVDVNVTRRKEKRCVPRYRRWLTREF